MGKEMKEFLRSGTGKILSILLPGQVVWYSFYVRVFLPMIMESGNRMGMGFSVLIPVAGYLVFSVYIGRCIGGMGAKGENFSLVDILKIGRKELREMLLRTLKFTVYALAIVVMAGIISGGLGVLTYYVAGENLTREMLLYVVSLGGLVPAIGAYPLLVCGYVCIFACERPAVGNVAVGRGGFVQETILKLKAGKKYFGLLGAAAVSAVIGVLSYTYLPAAADTVLMTAVSGALAIISVWMCREEEHKKVIYKEESCEKKAYSQETWEKEEKGGVL